MSLMKPRLMTAARIAASRRNALQSTGPRTARGKAQSSLNGLRSGRYSRTCQDLWEAFVAAAPGEVSRALASRLTPQQALHPCLTEVLKVFIEAEDSLCGKKGKRAARHFKAWLEALRTSSEAENLLKTLPRKNQPFEADKLLKTNPVSRFPLSF